MEMMINEAPDVIRVTVSGQLDSLSAGTFENRIKPLLELKPRDLMIDCAGLNFVSSMGLRALFTLAKLARRDGKTLTLAKVGEEVMNVLMLSGFSTFIRIER